MQLYDVIFKWKLKIATIFRTIRLCIIFYRNITFKGFENIHCSTELYGRQGGRVELGKGISTCRNCSIVSVGGRIKIGSNVFFSAYCKVVCHDQVIIGDNCIFGPNVSIYDHDHNYDNTGIIEGYKTSPITIEKNCWLGTNVTVLRGSHIGEGSIIGTGVIIRGNIPPHSLVVCEKGIVIRPIN